jgi:hypothetical protein
LTIQIYDFFLKFTIYNKKMLTELQHRKLFIESSNVLLSRLELNQLNEEDNISFFDKIFNIKELVSFFNMLLKAENNFLLTKYLDLLIANIKRISQTVKATLQTIGFGKFIDNFISKINNSANIKNLLKLSAVACIFNFILSIYSNTPKLTEWLNKLVADGMINTISSSFTDIADYISLLLKIVGSIAFVYNVLVLPYKEEILASLNKVKKFNMSKNISEHFNKATIYNKKKMKKVLITESQLRAMVRKMLMEQPIRSTPVGTSGFESETGQQPQTGQQQTQQPKVSPAAQSVITIINGPNGNTPLITKLKNIKTANDLTAIINFITSKTSVEENNTATAGRNVALGFRNIQTQAGG